MEIKSFVFNPFYENTYLIWDEDLCAVIIDPGCYEKEERQEITDFIKKKKLDVKVILNTHCHVDHVLGNYWLKEYLGCPVWIPENEVATLKAVEAYAPQWGITQYTPAVPNRLLAEGDELEIGRLRFQIIEVPGHSEGHQVFYAKQQKVLIGGDVLFRESIGRTDLPGGNHEQLLKNIREKIYTLPEQTVVYPGHGPSTTVGHEKKHNPFVSIAS